MSLNPSWSSALRPPTYAPPPPIRSRRSRLRRLARTLTPFGWRLVGWAIAATLAALAVLA